ncbi:restriction endonuclease subunit S [Aerococcus urinaeequi]|uniref:restriction endonuclease subunit S n=1 Tax=Aerococcus urinaeequi TaxID=51665 RepID=UPI003D6C1B08
MGISKDSQKVPILRFKRFTDDWEQRKLINVVDRVTRRNTNLQSKTPLTISAQFGLVDQITYFSKQVASKNMENYFLLYNGDFAYNKSYSKGYPFGAIKRLDSYDSGALSTLYIVFRPTIVDSNFLVHYFETTKWYAEIIKISAEGARNHGLLNITPSDFFDIKLFIPSKSVEQEKIGTLINYVENTIRLHQRKLDQLNQLKEALLQQMFPGKGETVPKLRFAGFEGEWEERKLGDISEMYQPQTITGHDLTESGYPVFGANGYIGYFSKYNHKSSQVTISARGEGTGTPSYVDGPVWITGNSMVINVDKNGIDKMFLYTNLLSFSLKKYVTGGAQPQLVRKVLTNVPIKIPSNEEQNKLGYFFGQLNANIINNKQKVSNLQSLKTVLLQNMFI